MLGFETTAFEMSAFETPNALVLTSNTGTTINIGSVVIQAGATILPINQGMTIDLGTVVLTADSNTDVTCNGLVISVG